MSDGANLGIDAQRALATILGGSPQPTEEEVATPEQVRERVMAAPSPLEGTPICARGLGGRGYALATDVIAKAFLLVAADDPGVLDQRIYWPDDHEYEPLRGKERDADSAVWEAVVERWPTFDDWLGGASGFMVGFAYNTARYVLSQPPAPNPAIVVPGDGS